MYGQCAANTFESNRFHPLKFFANKGINIRKMCTNVNAWNVFWITELRQVHGNGNNDYHQLGISDDNDNEYKQSLIDGLKVLIDVQSNRHYSVALCSNESPNTVIIIRCRQRTASSKMMKPEDIVNIIIKYYNANRVFSTGSGSSGGHGLGLIYVKTWTEIYN